MANAEDVTQLLVKVQEGDAEARETLARRVEWELRKIASAYLRRKSGPHSLQTTILIDDAFMRLVGDAAPVAWQSRTHFFRAAARAMRQMLVDHERRRRARKRPPEDRRLPAEALEQATICDPHVDLLALHEALEKLKEIDPRQAEVVQLRQFGGYTLEETARLLDVSRNTVKADWAASRAWLHRELSR
jgi:RNA polymerase sigma factor (TIGR02999 family)